MKPAVAIGIGAGALAVAGVLIWKFWDKLKDINKGTPYEGAGVVGTAGNLVNQALGGAPQALGEAIGSGLYSVFHQGDSDTGETTYLTTTFPDGSRHAIGASTIGADGRFTYNGTVYVLVNDKDGKHFAVRP